MAYLDSDRTASKSKRETRRGDPLELLKRLREQNPGLSREGNQKLFIRKMMDSADADDYFRNLGVMVHLSHYHDFDKQAPSASALKRRATIRAKQDASTLKEVRTQFRKIVQKEATNLLFKTLTCDGKPWGEVRYFELARMGKDGVIAKILERTIGKPVDHTSKVHELINETRFAQVLKKVKSAS